MRIDVLRRPSTVIAGRDPAIRAVSLPQSNFVQEFKRDGMDPTVKPWADGALMVTEVVSA